MYSYVRIEIIRKKSIICKLMKRLLLTCRSRTPVPFLNIRRHRHCTT